MGRGEEGKEKITHGEWRNFAVFALLIPKSVGGEKETRGYCLGTARGGDQRPQWVPVSQW